MAHFPPFVPPTHTHTHTVLSEFGGADERGDGERVSGADRQPAHTAGAAHQRRPLVTVGVTALRRQGQIGADFLHTLTVTLQKDRKETFIFVCKRVN